MSGRGKGPLAGVRVLDLTSVLMGPYATQIFADLGAEVIKVEPPAGDWARNMGRTRDGFSAVVLAYNAGKSGLCVDAGMDAGASDRASRRFGNRPWIFRRSRAERSGDERLWPDRGAARRSSRRRMGGAGAAMPAVAEQWRMLTELYPDDFPARLVPNYRLEWHAVTSGIPRGSWRAPAHTGARRRHTAPPAGRAPRRGRHR